MDLKAYQKALALLEKEQYIQLAELVASIGEQDGQIENDPGRKKTLMAAQCVSIACNNISTAIVMHRKCYLESRAHKRGLVSDLSKILEQAFDNRPAATTQPQREDGTGKATGATVPKGVLLHARELLKRTLSPPRKQEKSSERGVHESSAQRPSLTIYYLSPFQVYLDETPVERWSNGKGKLIFKYLGTRHGQPVAKEILMEMFWPNAKPQAARNNLNVAICGLRHTLAKVNPEYSYVLYKDGCYLLNPELHVWTDHESFLGHFKAAQKYELQGKIESAFSEYRLANALYQQDFLTENLYEDWAEPISRELKNFHTTLLERLSLLYFDQRDYESCATVCRKALLADSCHEDFHRLLMRCYSRLGHTHLALRQYHYCKEALGRELNAAPGIETRRLYEQIRLGEAV